MNLALDMEHEDLTHLVDLLLWLETVGATHAVENHRDEDRLEARRLLENLRQSIGETSRWIAADTIFHSAIVGMSGNPLLASIFEGVHTTLISYEYEPWVQNDAVPSWLYENEADHELAVHEPMVEALESGDRDAMVAAVKLHNDAVRLHLSLRRAPQG
jgi:GntR family transcriptional repressor for pyruvate dehydrogenase complex